MKKRISTGLRIEVEGDFAEVVGPRALMAKTLPLRDMNYVEIDGMIRTSLHDPIAHMGRQNMNCVMMFHRTRRGREAREVQSCRG